MTAVNRTIVPCNIGKKRIAVDKIYIFIAVFSARLTVIFNGGKLKISSVKACIK